MNQYLIYIIPVFLSLIIFEMIADAVTHKKVYKFEDTITNISLGIGQQVIEALIKTLFSFLFICVYKYSIFKIPDTILTFFAVVLICDFIYYWFHRFCHTINALWAVHVVHHQSREFNLSVSLRQPWLHKFAMFAFYLIIPFLGVSPTIMIIAFAVQAFSQFWLHTRFIGKIGLLEYVLVTPSHHRVHHGANDIYLNKNFGNTLIIWDKLFGTFQEEKEPVVFGITTSFNSVNPIWANIYYWKEIMNKAKKVNGFFNKLLTFFKNPADNTEEKTMDRTVKPLRLYISRSLSAYIIAHYILIFTLFVFFIVKQNYLPVLWKIIPAIFIIWSIYNISALMAQKKYSILFEMIRIIVLCQLVYFFLTSGNAN